MNPLTNVRNIGNLNEQDLKNGIFDHKLTWHSQYKDSAYIFVGGLPYDLTEGDVLCVFSQYGEIVNINLVRDKNTGKSLGYCFICYEDQRSTILAVDNFNAIKLGGRTIRVDHVSEYRAPKSEEKDEDGRYKSKIEVGCAPSTPSPTPSEDYGSKSKSDKKKRKKNKKEKKKKKKKKRTDLKESGSDSSENEGCQLDKRFEDCRKMDSDKYDRLLHHSDFYKKTESKLSSGSNIKGHSQKENTRRKGESGWDQKGRNEVYPSSRQIDRSPIQSRKRSMDRSPIQSRKRSMDRSPIRSRKRSRSWSRDR